MNTEDVSRSFEMLAKPERRCLLYYLRENDTAPVETLVDLLVGWRHAHSGEEVGPEDGRRVRIMLDHVHLPHLVDCGVVRYDESEKTVELAALSPYEEDLLDVALDSEQDLHEAVQKQVASSDGD
jgi:hypothetical protein